MKRTITAVLAGGAVFGATVAFAATMTVNGNNLGADADAVSSCDDEITVDYTVAWDEDENRYEVSSVTVKDIDATACNGETLKVTLTGTGGAAIDEVQTAVSAGSHTLSVDDNILPASVTGVAAVLYDAATS